MKKWILLTLLLASLLPAWWAYDFYLAPRAAYDGQGNHYRLRIDADARRAYVEADIWLSSNMLSMFDVTPTAGLPNGHLDLIEGLQVTDQAGAAVWLRDLGLGDYAVRGGRRLRMSYQVRLEHDQFDWPAGTEEVGYWTEDGVMIGGSRLFFADGEQQIEGAIDLQIALPNGWQAHTPWPAGGEPGQFVPSSRRDLLSNVMFLGTPHVETLNEGGVELTLVLGRPYVASAGLFRELLSSQLRSYHALFAAAPLSKRYLIIINPGESGDGGAFSSSFSQFIRGGADPINRVNWGYVMAHELLHFWNGLSLIPEDEQEEWFKEGATDYLTIVTLAQNGWIDHDLLMKRLENVPRRYLMARMLQRLDMSVRQAGYDKQPNRLLVYGGGSLAALALDVELRRHSNNRIGLPDLMARLYAEHAGAAKRYRLADIERIASELTGADYRGFFAEAVESGRYFDIEPYLREAGLRMDAFVEEIYIQPDPSAPADARARGKSMFGSAFEPATTPAPGLPQAVAVAD